MTSADKIVAEYQLSVKQLSSRLREGQLVAMLRDLDLDRKCEGRVTKITELPAEFDGLLPAGHLGD